MTDGVRLRLAPELERALQLRTNLGELIELCLRRVLALPCSEDSTTDADEVSHGFEGERTMARHGPPKGARDGRRVSPG